MCRIWRSIFLNLYDWKSKNKRGQISFQAIDDKKKERRKKGQKLQLGDWVLKVSSQPLSSQETVSYLWCKLHCFPFECYSENRLTSWVLMFQTLMSCCECVFPVSLQNNNNNNNKSHEITLCPFFPHRLYFRFFKLLEESSSPLSPFLMVEYSCVASATVLRPHSVFEPLQDSTYVQ